MTSNVTLLTVIPARGGSKRLPNKNILTIGGMPLIHWTILAARLAGIPEPVVSTDSPLVEAACLLDNVTVLKRPPELAEDDTPTIKVLHHALAWSDAKGTLADWLLLLQPTSPLRSPDDIAAAMGSVCQTCGGAEPTCQSSILTVTSTAPLGSVGGAQFKTNGAIYLIHRNTLLRGSLYGDEPFLIYMPPERSIDIDTQEDFEKVKQIWKSELASPSLLRAAGHT